MRLINVRTWRLEEFPGTDIPQYAVLSHTWDTEEVSFQDMRGWLIQFRKRFAKIRATCQQAMKDNIDYVWVDTCCIDKSSSAELTEAINSMFAYYRNAVVCYVLLSDLNPSIETNTGLPQCRWFTRGWTLQELIAPPEVRFYDSAWKFRGTTIDLLKAISRITHIRSDVLQWRAQPKDPLRSHSQPRKCRGFRTERRREPRTWRIASSGSLTSTCPCYTAKGLELSGGSRSKF